MDIASQVIHNQAPLSRRGFLKITATSALSLVFGKMIDLPSQVVEDQCRVIDASIKMYNIPSFE
ncbi:MAG: twin-arginine translocation signal domain-containing protein, partial [Anaerolineales bacterium]|nr:twin-arginine translocation signal domain-containing protein [Anaerolineales bacterium]